MTGRAAKEGSAEVTTALAHSKVSDVFELDAVVSELIGLLCEGGGVKGSGAVADALDQSTSPKVRFPSSSKLPSSLRVSGNFGLDAEYCLPTVLGADDVLPRKDPMERKPFSFLPDAEIGDVGVEGSVGVGGVEKLGFPLPLLSLFRKPLEDTRLVSLPSATPL